MISLILPIPGALALIYGDRVSAALISVHAGITSRVMGGFLLVGGILTLIGVARGRSYVEAVGLITLAAGCGIYGIGVILGLGLAGAVAGSGYLALASASVLRVATLAAIAHRLKVPGARQ